MAKRPYPPQTFKGTIRLNPRGFGFVTLEDNSLYKQDIFIPKHLVGSAVDGDEVLVDINPTPTSEKGPDGRVLEILQRGHNHLAGTICSTDEAIFAHVPLLGENRNVIVKKPKRKKLKIGDRLLLNVLEWGDKKKPTICEMIERLGHIDDASKDVVAGAAEFNLPRHFPKEVIVQAKSFAEKVTPEETKGRLDLTQATCLTIDPETAKDFDDALSIEKDKRGHFFLGVHIADVAHYIKPNTPLDKEAAKRCNSTYFPGKCIPMLPEELSNNLCSLKENVVRLTVSVLIEFDEEGQLLNSQVKRSFIRSKKRMTYPEAKAILEGKKKSPHVKHLKKLEELCLLLQKIKRERGTIELGLPELILLLDNSGEPKGVRIEEYHIAHQMVEEFMLKANEVVAKTLADQGKQVLYRVHEEPANENIEEFFSKARALGFQVPEKATFENVANLFEQAKNTPYQQQLAIHFIRNLKLASYSPENLGHFGLALEHYCHFTSPIRRYSDLITERLLFDEEDKEQSLEKIAKTCSDQERISFRAETSVKRLKKLRLLDKWCEEDHSRVFKALVASIKPFGIYFEVQDLFLEGFLHISELANDYFVFDPKQEDLRGRTTGIRYVVGKEITVRPLTIDFVYLETTWELINS